MTSNTPQAKVEPGLSIRMTRTEIVELAALLKNLEAPNLTSLAVALDEMARRRGWLPAS